MSDPIRTLMGAMSDSEYRKRRHILNCRDVATYRAHRTGGPNARGLLWSASELATAYVFEHAPLAQLAEVGGVCSDLIELAERANRLEADDGLANT